jgi:hypothetical protein
MNGGQIIHPMQLHGMAQEVVAQDGFPPVNQHQSRAENDQGMNGMAPHRSSSRQGVVRAHG